MYDCMCIVQLYTELLLLYRYFYYKQRYASLVSPPAVALCCSVLLCVALWCSVLLCVASPTRPPLSLEWWYNGSPLSSEGGLAYHCWARARC